MLTINNNNPSTDEIIPNATLGVYCFINEEDKVIYANITDDIAKGKESCTNKLEHKSHHNKDFITDYMCDKLKFVSYPTKTWEEATTIINDIPNNGYKLVKL